MRKNRKEGIKFGKKLPESWGRRYQFGDETAFVEGVHLRCSRGSEVAKKRGGREEIIVRGGGIYKWSHSVILNQQIDIFR